MSHTKPSIFLSYARNDDEPFVKRMYEDLTKRGFDIWWDRICMPSRHLAFQQEIRDAIAGRDRLLLVIGPNAVTSEYVTDEWKFALEAGKVVTPILRTGDYTLVPDELKLLHCEHFRDEENFVLHLDNLARQLAEPAPQLGKLIAVPSLPPHYLARTDRLIRVRDALRSDLDRPVITSEAARIGIHGMAGIGKSVLAAAVAHDRLVRAAFPDGIVWIAIGSKPDIPEIQRRVHRELGGDGSIQTATEGRTRLKTRLADKSVLLIFDDVWQRSDIDDFDVLGPRCRGLVTTRDAGLLNSLCGTQYVVELLSDAEALHLLATASGIAENELPLEASRIIAECGRLPLAVALSGAMIRSGTPWQNILDALFERDLEFLEDSDTAERSHADLLRTMQISVDALSSDEQCRFAELAVFPASVAIPESFVASLWCRSKEMSEFSAKMILENLKKRSLVQRTRPVDVLDVSVSYVSVHNLVHDFAVRLSQKLTGGLAPLHAHMARFYSAMGLPNLRGDVIALKWLPYHAYEANETALWLAAMTDFGFLQAVVERVDLTEGQDSQGVEIPWHDGYFIVLDAIKQWLDRKPEVSEAAELIEPLQQVWERNQEFIRSPTVMQTLYHELKALEKMPPKEVFDRDTRRIVLQHGPLWSWCEREREKYEVPGKPWASLSRVAAEPRCLAFISYRREGGSETARGIREGLLNREILSFLDVDDLRSRHFDERLLSEIESLPNFIVILTPGSLDRCKHEGDWLRREIEHAIETSRNIIPILKDGFEFPLAEELPASMATLHKNNAVSYSHEFFSATLDKIEAFLER